MNRVAIALFAVAMLASPLVRAADSTCSASYESAQRSRNGGHLVEARISLLECVSAACPKFIVDDCTGWLVEIDAALPTIVFALLASDGTDLHDGTLLVDGAIVTRADDGLPHSVDPGAHTVELRARGARVMRQIIVRSGEKGRRIDLRLEPASGTTTFPSSSSPQTTRPTPATTWIFGALAIGFASAGTVLWIDGKNAADDYNASCGAGSCTSARHDLVRRELVLGDVAWLVGAACAATSVIAFVTRPTRQTQVGFSFGPAGGFAIGSF